MISICHFRVSWQELAVLQLVTGMTSLLWFVIRYVDRSYDSSPICSIQMVECFSRVPNVHKQQHLSLNSKIRWSQPGMATARRCQHQCLNAKVLQGRRLLIKRLGCFCGCYCSPWPRSLLQILIVHTARWSYWAAHLKTNHISFTLKIFSWRKVKSWVTFCKINGFTWFFLCLLS